MSARGGSAAPAADGTRLGATPPEATPAELAATLRALVERVERLEAELDALRGASVAPEVPEDVVIAVSAAVAAFLGHRAKVKQVHYRTGQAWAQQGRAVVQGHHNIHDRSR
jgi:methylmalonyl-CoA carboxyltransferase 12S subunit